MNLLRLPLGATLVLDAIGSGAMALPLAIAAGFLAPILGLPEMFLRAVGLILLPYVVVLVVAGSRPRAATLLAPWIVTGNVIWIVASLGVLASGWLAPTLLGQAFIIAQAITVAGFAALQAIARRHERRATAAAGVS